MPSSLLFLVEILILFNLKDVLSYVPSSQSSSQNAIEEKMDIRGFKPKQLHIGGLFPMSGNQGWRGGPGCRPAIEMALEDVNSRLDILPGYYLQLTKNDSKCDPGLASAVLYDLVYHGPVKILVLSGCSTVTETIAETAKMYNLVVFAYGSSSPALSNRNRFPTFFRTHPSATIHNPTRVKFFQKFGWKRIAIILEAESVFISTAKDLEERCRKVGIEVLVRVQFMSGDPKDAVKSLAQQDARIIVGMFYVGQARKVMCEAYKHNLYGKQHVWFLIGWYEDNWYSEVDGLNCTKEEMLTAVNGHFTTEAVFYNKDNKETVAGMTYNDWLGRYHDELNKTSAGYQEAPLAYDAIWSIALALNSSIHKLRKRGLSIEDFNYTRKDISQEIQNSLRDTSFLGVSGEVKFTDEGDRIALTQIEQMIDGEYKVVSYYDTQDDNLTWQQPVTWLITGRAPSDRTVIVTKLKTVSFSFFVALNTISGIGILWSLGLLCFTYKFRKFRYIQMSQPVSNYIMLIGCIGCLSCIILFGLDSQKIAESFFTTLCHVRAVVLSLSFSLAFGAMFTKVWFAYRLSTQMEQSSKNKKVENAQVILMIALFCLIDLIILICWFWKSPMERKVEMLEHEEIVHPDEDKKIKKTLERCDTNLVWYCVMFGYKGLLLIFGLFLAYETRSVKLKRINDSRLVGMSIYNVVILCMITGPVSLVIVNHVDAHFGFITGTILFCCFISMALIFIPKIVELVRKRGSHFSFGDSCMNGTFHEAMSIQEQEERLKKLTRENDELQAKITEKESQIDEVRRQMEEIMKKKDGETYKQNRKAVRIQEPEEQRTVGTIHLDPASDSGYTSTRNSRPSDFETSESYL